MSHLDGSKSLVRRPVTV